jgi:hypothetical protein
MYVSFHLLDMLFGANFSLQLVYLIIIVSTGHAALPTIAIVMIAVTYGLQVCAPDAQISASTDLYYPGHHFHSEARVYALWLDGCLHSFVRFL